MFAPSPEREKRRKRRKEKRFRYVGRYIIVYHTLCSYLLRLSPSFSLLNQSQSQAATGDECNWKLPPLLWSYLSRSSSSLRKCLNSFLSYFVYNPCSNASVIQSTNPKPVNIAANMNLGANIAQTITRET